MERAIAIVTCFDPDVADLGLSEIAARVGLRVSTAHRITHTLVRGGLLAQDPRSERYHLGPKLAILGQSAMAQYGLDLVQPHLEELARVTGEAASLGVRDGDDVVVMLRAESAQPLRFDRPHGSRVPLHASAMGKALLAFAAVEPRVAVARLERLPRFTGHTIVKRSALVAELEAIRAQGYTVNREERHEGVCGVGAPVLDRSGVRGRRRPRTEQPLRRPRADRARPTGHRGGQDDGRWAPPAPTLTVTAGLGPRGPERPSRVAGASTSSTRPEPGHDLYGRPRRRIHRRAALPRRHDLSHRGCGPGDIPGRHERPAGSHPEQLLRSVDVVRHEGDTARRRLNEGFGQTAISAEEHDCARGAANQDAGVYGAGPTRARCARSQARLGETTVGPPPRAGRFRTPPGTAWG